MKVSRTSVSIAVVVVAIVVGFGANALASSNATPVQGRLVTVSGTATVSTHPDEAVVGLGVRSEAADADAAMRANAAKMAAVVKALAVTGVDRRHVETTQVSLGRQVVDAGTSSEHTVFVAQNTIEATIADLQTTGAVIDAAVRAGVDQVRNIRFQVSDPKEVRRRALRQAVESSREKASVMAQAAGASIAGVLSIREQSAPAPITYAAPDSLAFKAATPVIPTHQIETRVTVSAVWTLGG